VNNTHGTKLHTYLKYWISEVPKHKKCTEFANYILENYINIEQFPLTMWAEEPNGTRRTTNGTESYHSQLRFEFYMPHPSVFQFVRIKTIY